MAIHQSSPRTRCPKTAISATLTPIPRVASTVASPMLGRISDHFVVSPPSARMMTRPRTERVGQLGIVELDPGLVEQHADTEEEQQGRQPNRVPSRADRIATITTTEPTSRIRSRSMIVAAPSVDTRRNGTPI